MNNEKEKPWTRDWDNYIKSECTHLVTIVRRSYCLEKKIIHTSANANIAIQKRNREYYSEQLLTVG